MFKSFSSDYMPDVAPKSPIKSKLMPTLVIKSLGEKPEPLNQPINGQSRSMCNVLVL